MKRKRSMIHRQAGLSIVEFMVGIAVGLFIVGGATKLFADFIVSNKRLLLETRVNQDLRAAADIVVRDVRRAGYWNNAIAGVWGTGNAAVTPNPHGAVTPATGTGTAVSYSYARNAGDTLDDNERTGFRLLSVGGIGVLQIWDGGAVGSENYQAITDPGTVDVTTFSVTAPSPTLVNDLSSYCGCLTALTCTNTSAAGLIDIANLTFNPAGKPTLTIPSFQVVLTGRSVADPTIVRTVSEAVRVRNASLTGSCPP